MKLSRPVRWQRKENIAIHSKRYDMKKVHGYVKRCIKGTSADIKDMRVFRGLTKYGYWGYSVFEMKKVMIHRFPNTKSNEFYLTILHEIFHFFFRDAQDDRQREVQVENDFVERRAELSAVNMLEWYEGNKKEYSEFRNLAGMLPVCELSEDELELL